MAIKTLGQKAQNLGADVDEVVSTMYESGVMYEEAVREFKKRFIRRVMKANRNNQCKAARELGIHRNTLSRQVNSLMIEIERNRRGGNNQRKHPEAIAPQPQEQVTA